MLADLLDMARELATPLNAVLVCLQIGVTAFVWRQTLRELREARTHARRMAAIRARRFGL